MKNQIQNGEKTLTILQLNDLHGYLEPHWELVRDNGSWSFKRMGGLARISALFESIRKSSDGATITLDNGDTFHGTYIATHDRGHTMIPLMNHLKFDAMTTHWEFAYSPKGVKEIAGKLNYPMLAINCFNKESGDLFFQPYQMVRRNQLNIAIIGLACPIVDKTMPPPFSEGVRFATGVQELPHWIQIVREREQADVVIVLSHVGFPQDVQIAKDVEGIDIIVSGHTHNRMEKAIIENGTVIFQSGCHGSFIGKLVATISNGKITSFTHDLIPVDESLPEDPQLCSLVEEAYRPHRKHLSEVVGQLEQPVHRYSMLSSSMDDLLLKAISRAASCNIVFSNGWRYGAPLPEGPVTINDLWNIIPVNPPIQTVIMTGAEIWEMLEENLEKTFSSDPYEQMGGYVKRMRGVTLYMKAENPKGHRIDRLFIGNEKIQMEKEYPVAYVTAQGVPNKFGKDRKKLPVDAITALKLLFQSEATVKLAEPTTVIEI